MVISLPGVAQDPQRLRRFLVESGESWRRLELRVGGNAEEDMPRVEAAAAAVDRLDEPAASFMGHARGHWSEHGLDIALEGPLGQNAGPLPALLDDRADLRRLQDVLSTEVASSFRTIGPAWARARWQNLAWSLRATADVAQAHDAPAGAPLHYRPPAQSTVEPGIGAALLRLADAIDKALKQVVAEDPDRLDVHAFSSNWGEKAWMGAEHLAALTQGQARQELIGAMAEVQAVWREATGPSMPAEIRDRLPELRDVVEKSTQGVRQALDGLRTIDDGVLGNQDEVYRRFLAALDAGRVGLAPGGSGIGVGFVTGQSAPAGGLRGKELLYVPEAQQLFVSDLTLPHAEFARGLARERLFARTAFGTPDSVLYAGGWDGNELGALGMHVGRGWGQEDVESIIATVGAGANSLPLVDFRTVYRAERSNVHAIPLDEVQEEAIHGMISETPDVAKAWGEFVCGQIGPK